MPAQPNSQPQHGRGQRQDNRQYEQPPISGITAPYNFVPLAPHVFQPDWQASIDEPLSDGLCGTLDFTITAYSPLLVGGKLHEGEPVFPYRFPDGAYGIPGSTIRGMVRNVLEIASFGKMGLVDDKRYAVRDLTPGARKFYGNLLTSTAGRQQYKPKSLAGWLQFVDGHWQVLPCDFARIEHHEIKQFLGGNWVRISNKDRPDAEEKYKVWKNSGKQPKVKFDAGKPDFHPHSHGKRLYYSKATRLGSGSLEGTMIFTGQPGPNKHLEFIFFAEQPGGTRVIPEKVMQGFLQIYANTDHWKALQKMKAQFGHGIPVFYLEDKGEISSLGLSLMYKLAYHNSVGEVVERMQEGIECYPGDKNSRQKPDLAELIFGSVDEVDGTHSLKGRVSFAHAVCERDASSIRIRKHTTILNGPKPTYYPNYIEQQQENGQLKHGDAGYATFMDKDARIRGWKRYPVRPDVQVQRLSKDQEENKKVQVELHPLLPESGLTFRSRMRFHNLNPVELGALLWVLEWGGKPELRHNVGMGKPFGFGQVGITLDSATEDSILPNNFTKARSLADYRGEFEARMEVFCQEKTSSNWKNSNQITQLLAMADPANAPGQPGGLAHLDLAGGGKNNEFVIAKKSTFVLQPYAAGGSSAISAPAATAGNNSFSNHSPAGVWLQQTVDGIAKETNTAPDKVLHAKQLAQQWQELDDAELKADVLTMIKAYWQKQGWWDEPNGKSAKIAHTIYTAGS